MRNIWGAFALISIFLCGCARSSLQQGGAGLPPLGQSDAGRDNAPVIRDFKTANPNLETPFELAFSKHGWLWFTASSAHLGVMPTVGKFESRNLPIKTGPAGVERADEIAMGPNGRLWFTDYYDGTLGTITPSAHAKQYHVFSGIGGYSAGLVSGPNGHLWVMLTGGYSTVVEVDTTPHVVNAYQLNGAYQETIALGQNDTLWIGGSAQYQVITRFTSDHQITDFPVTCADGIWGIAAGPDGNMWFTGATGNNGKTYVSKITPYGQIEEYPTTSQGAGITAGPDGNVWFTEPWKGLIGKVTMTGNVTEYKIPKVVKNSSPQYQDAGIVAGPDGNLWFTEPMRSKIGEVVLAP